MADTGDLLLFETDNIGAKIQRVVTKSRYGIVMSISYILRSCCYRDEVGYSDWYIRFECWYGNLHKEKHNIKLGSYKIKLGNIYRCKWSLYQVKIINEHKLSRVVLRKL